MAFADTIRSSKTTASDIATLLENLLCVRGVATGTTLINTTSSTYVDYTSGTTTLAVPSNCYVKVEANIAFSVSATQRRINFILLEDGVQIGQSWPCADPWSSTDGFTGMCQFAAYSSPAAGSHTYKIQWKLQDTAGSPTAYSTRFMLQVYCFRMG